jgi:hypothetical protein
MGRGWGVIRKGGGSVGGVRTGASNTRCGGPVADR